jgi:hypothetical protein
VRDFGEVHDAPVFLTRTDAPVIGDVMVEARQLLLNRLKELDECDGHSRCSGPQ